MGRTLAINEVGVVESLELSVAQNECQSITLGNNHAAEGPAGANRELELSTRMKKAGRGPQCAEYQEPPPGPQKPSEACEESAYTCLQKH